MLPSERLAMAAHLHVVLRRKTGRVTDTEWMVTNATYAAEVVRFARSRAAQDGEPELAAWADRLELAMGLRPPPPAAAPASGPAGPHVAEPVATGESRYVGGLR